MSNGHPLNYASVIEIDVAQSGDEAETIVRIENSASHDVTISGADVSCFCTTVHGLPKTLKPCESIDFRVTVDTEGMKQGLNQQRFRFFTDRYSETPYCIVNINVAAGPLLDGNSKIDTKSSVADR